MLAKNFILVMFERYMTAALFKKELFQSIIKYFPYWFYCEKYRTAILKETHLIRTSTVTGSVYANNFVKREINIPFYNLEQYRKIQKRKRRFGSGVFVTHATCKVNFFVTLVIGSKFAAKYSFFRTYIF